MKNRGWFDLRKNRVQKHCVLIFCFLKKKSYNAVSNHTNENAVSIAVIPLNRNNRKCNETNLPSPVVINKTSKPNFHSHFLTRHWSKSLSKYEGTSEIQMNSSLNLRWFYEGNVNWLVNYFRQKKLHLIVIYNVCMYKHSCKCVIY